MTTYTCPRCRKELAADQFKWVGERRIKNCFGCVQYHNEWMLKRDEALEEAMKLDPEEWRDHPTYSDYACDRYGYVVNKKTNKMIGCVMTNGYIRLGIYIQGKTTNILAHRFIYETWVGSIADGFVINHIDEHKDNNTLVNLECVTKSENSFKSSHKAKGICVSRSVVGVDQSDLTSHIFESSRDAGRQTGCNHNSIGMVSKGQTNTTVSKTTGHQWKFSYPIEEQK